MKTIPSLSLGVRHFALAIQCSIFMILICAAVMAPQIDMQHTPVFRNHPGRIER